MVESANYGEISTFPWRQFLWTRKFSLEHHGWSQFHFRGQQGSMCCEPALDNTEVPFIWICVSLEKSISWCWGETSTRPGPSLQETPLRFSRTQRCPTSFAMGTDRKLRSIRNESHFVWMKTSKESISDAVTLKFLTALSCWSVAIKASTSSFLIMAWLVG